MYFQPLDPRATHVPPSANVCVPGVVPAVNTVNVAPAPGWGRIAGSEVADSFAEAFTWRWSSTPVGSLMSTFEPRMTSSAALSVPAPSTIPTSTARHLARHVICMPPSSDYRVSYSSRERDVKPFLMVNDGPHVHRDLTQTTYDLRCVCRQSRWGALV
jgi:hypothetical protein